MKITSIIKAPVKITKKLTENIYYSVKEDVEWIGDTVSWATECIVDKFTDL